MIMVFRVSVSSAVEEETVTEEHLYKCIRKDGDGGYWEWEAGEGKWLGRK